MSFLGLSFKLSRGNCHRHSPSKLIMMLLQVQIMLRKSGKGGAGVRSVQVASDSSLGEQFIMREEREIR